MASLKSARLNIIKSRLFISSSRNQKLLSVPNKYLLFQQALPSHTIFNFSSPFTTSKLCFSTTSRLSAEDSQTKEQIEKLVKNNKVVVFMKGDPEKPMCGFSNAVVQILRMHGVQYDSHNVLEDESLRTGIKTFSDWPTIPQVYFKGEFIGGCDILLQLHQSGDLIDELKNIGIRSALLDKK